MIASNQARRTGSQDDAMKDEATPRDRLIVALDQSSLAEARRWYQDRAVPAAVVRPGR
jgi:hypothetical protein